MRCAKPRRRYFVRKTGWIVTLLLSLVLAGGAQQDKAKTNPDAPPEFSRSHPASGPNVPVPAACPATFDDSPETNGIAGDFRHGVTAPRPTRTPEAGFSEKARKALKKQHLKSFDGVSILSMIVDVDGVPRDLCLKKSAGYGLDASAAKAAWQYRFAPATKDGKPVPARISLEVNFRLY